TVPGAIAFLPRKAILSTGRADDSLGELTDLTLSAFKHRVFILGFDIAVTDLNRVKLVSTDATHQDLLAPSSRVEIPLACELHERNGKRPIVASNVERHAIRIVRIRNQALLGASLFCELGCHFPIARRFTSMNNVGAVGTQDLLESVFIILLGCRCEGIDRFLSGCEAGTFRGLRASLSI